MEQKFGINDYRESLNQLLELQQHTTLEQYISTFEDLRYQVAMHNSELGEVFFSTQFLRGLKPEIGNVVQSQIPETLDRAMLLAKIQQQGKIDGPNQGTITKQLFLLSNRMRRVLLQLAHYGRKGKQEIT